jgi:hypothetical protein
MQPIIILKASQQPYISLGVKFGGITIEKTAYVYHPVKDAFIQKKYAKQMKGKTWDEFVEFVKNIAQ